MAGSSGGGGGVPPGFRFHPTDEELLQFYLKKKISFQKFDMEVIREVDLNKIEPWDLQEKCKIGSTPQNEWYFFSHKDRKYPTGSRTNRATSAGFWKATGRDKCIRNSFKKMGMRKTLVFYRGRAPHGQKTDWIMHEYRLQDSDHNHPHPTHEDGWVICRVFKKKNLLKIGSGEQGGQHYHNNNNNGMMMMMEDQMNMNMNTSSNNNNMFGGMSHHQYVQADLNYSQQYIEAQHFKHPPPMLSSPNSGYDDHLSTADYDNTMQVKQFMSSSTRDHDQCESSPLDQNLSQWDPLVNPTTSINHLSLRSNEMQDFWAYGK